MKKMKALFLGTYDQTARGHVMYAYQHFYNDMDKRVVVLCSKEAPKDYAIDYFESLKMRIKRKVNYLAPSLYNALRYIRSGRIVVPDLNNPEYYYFCNEFGHNYADKILEKCGKDFIPDVIFVYWVSGFINSATLRSLYERTKAQIIWLMVDEAPLGGGCHYPNMCEGYLSGCNDCPALKYGKKVAHEQIELKRENLAGLPITIVGAPDDCRKISQSYALKGCKTIPSIVIPQMLHFDKQECRKEFDIPEDSFVLMVGANSLKDIRKGFKYVKEALPLLKNRDNVCVLAPGEPDSSWISDGIRIIQPGFLNMEQLTKCYCASDCFVSTSIADSGPVMVNYAAVLDIPIVSFNIGIAQDMVRHKQNGFIADYKNAASVAEGIDYLHGLTDPMRKKMMDYNHCLLDQYRNLKTAQEQIYEFLNAVKRKDTES